MVSKTPKPERKQRLLPSVGDLSVEHPQRIPFPPTAAGVEGVYGPLTNGQRIARHLKAEIVAGISALSAALLRHGALEAELRELIIVRTGYQIGSAYEVHQHRSLALRLGVPVAKLDALALVTPEGLTNDEAAVIRFVDEIVTCNRPTDETLSDLRTRLSDGEILEIVIVTGNWWSLARMLETAAVPLDAGTIGELGVVSED